MTTRDGLYDHCQHGAYADLCITCHPDQATSPAWCNLHSRFDCTLCDDCGHEGDAHTNAWDQQQVGAILAAEYIFAQATCWGENICATCRPDLAAQAGTLAALPLGAR